jgi:hypothetical protein
VVQLPNNKLGRIPYLWPYVSLTSRAKIPPIMQKDFNLQVWKNNAVFYSNLKNKLTIADLDEYFINFCEYVGFDTKITVEDFCIQHVNLFENKENMIC